VDKLALALANVEELGKVFKEQADLMESIGLEGVYV